MEGQVWETWQRNSTLSDWFDTTESKSKLPLDDWENHSFSTSLHSGKYSKSGEEAGFILRYFRSWHSQDWYYNRAGPFWNLSSGMKPQHVWKSPASQEPPRRRAQAELDGTRFPPSDNTGNPEDGHCSHRSHVPLCRPSFWLAFWPLLVRFYSDTIRVEAASLNSSPSNLLGRCLLSCLASSHQRETIPL